MAIIGTGRALSSQPISWSSASRRPCNLTIVVLLLLLLLSCVQTSGSGVIDTTLAPLPQDVQYKAAGTEYDDGGMGPMYDFARSFINSALPGGFPTEFVNETLNGLSSGAIDVTTLATDLLNTFKGYIAAIVVGFMFIIIVPIVGCCFCCCRTCGNCGGKRVQAQSGNMKLKQWIFTGIVFVIVVFIFVGNICMYVSNDRMSGALDEISETANNNLDDMDTFLDNVVNQIEVIGHTNLNITRDATLEKMDANVMSSSLSEYVLNELSNGALTSMEANIAEVEVAAGRLSSSMSALTTACSSLPICALPDAITNAEKDFNTSVNAFTSNNPISQVKGDLEANISTAITSSIGNAKTSVETAFSNMFDQVNTAVQEINNFRSSSKDDLNVESAKQKVKDYTDSAHDFDKYRHMTGAILGAIVTIVVALQVIALVFGVVGYSSSSEPHERGCVSNAGGNMLMASVAFMFIFSALLMLLTTICFSVGAILERFVCQPLSDPDLQLLKVGESMMLSDVKTALGAPISSVMKDCRAGKSAYTAFNLKSKFDLDDIDQQLQNQEQIIGKQMNDTLSSVADIGGESDYDTKAANSFSDLNKALNSTLVLEDALKALLDPEKTILGRTLTDVFAAIDELKAIQLKIPTWQKDFEDGMKKARTEIKGKLGTLVTSFMEGILDITREYVRSTKSSIENDVGRCNPVWNLYHSIVVVAMCQYTVDAFNGFWFSIGWCLFFFVPSIIFSVKLAKYFRTMSSPDVEFAHDGFINNKVGPSG